jgi:hypothetical protein
MTNLTELKATVTDSPPRIVIYGSGGIGKSSFAADAPDVIFGDIEGGLDGIESAKVPINSWADILQFITDLHEQDHAFKTVAIDSTDWLERLIHKQVASENGKETIEAIGYGAGYKMALDLWSQFLQGMDSLRVNKGMTVILISHEQIKRYNDPTMDSYDRFTLKTHDLASAMIFEWADAVMFARKKIRIEKEKSGFNQETAKAKSIGDLRVLQTVDHPAYMAKNRKSLSLPDEIALSWDGFVSSIGQGGAK